MLSYALGPIPLQYSPETPPPSKIQKGQQTEPRKTFGINPPPLWKGREKKTIKMSNFLWNEQTIQYVLREFDKGFTVAQIHDELVRAGYNVQLGTIEQTLRANNRNIDGPNPLARPTYISNSYGPPGNPGPWYNQPGNQVTHQHVVRNDSYVYTWQAQGYEGLPPQTAPGRFAPQSNQGRHWDAQAARFTIDAHRSGQSVLQIWSDLRRRGYVVNAAEVAASLSAQGVSGVHVADYLGR